MKWQTRARQDERGMSGKTRLAGLLVATGLLVTAGLLYLGSRDRPTTVTAADFVSLPVADHGNADAGLSLPSNLAEYQKPIPLDLEGALSNEQDLSKSYARTKASGQGSAVLLVVHAPPEETVGAGDAVRAAYALGWSLSTVAAYCREERMDDAECSRLVQAWLDVNRWPGLLPRWTTRP